MTEEERVRRVIAEQEKIFEGVDDAELLLAARDAFDEAAQLCHQGISQGDLRRKINDAYRLSTRANAALETFARRMKTRHEEKG
jgi:hypothetical protein